MSKTLHHDLITSNGKDSDAPVAERHELVLLFDCEKSNPNGDPDTGNMPRLQPDSLKGLVTDVCLKRKIRNFFSLNQPNGQPLGKALPDGYRIFIREDAILQQVMESPEIETLAKSIFEKELGQNLEAWDAKKKPRKGKAKTEDTGNKETQKENEISPADDFKKQAYRAALLLTFVDLRSFGGVISTEGPLKGSFYGQVRGPVQFTFSESLDKVLQIDATITRCAVASEKEKKQAAAETEEAANRTMGRKHGIDYGLYRCHIHFSPAFAAKTGFTYYDLDNFLFALKHMFTDDHAAGRHLRLVGLVDFQHQSSLGNAPAHKLFEKVEVSGIKYTKEEAAALGKPELEGKFKSSGSEFPQGLHDYRAESPGGLDKHTPVPGFQNITARKIVWEFSNPGSAAPRRAQ